MQLDFYCLHRCREQSFAIRAYAMSAVGLDGMSVQKLFAYRIMSTVRIDAVSSHMNTAESHMVSQDSRMHCKVQMKKDLLFYGVLIVFQPKEWNETRLSLPCLKSSNEDFSVGF